MIKAGAAILDITQSSIAKHRSRNKSRPSLSFPCVVLQRRQQELSQWQDTVKLKHERRKAEKELRSAMLDLEMVHKNSGYRIYRFHRE